MGASAIHRCSDANSFPVDFWASWGSERDRHDGAERPQRQGSTRRFSTSMATTPSGSWRHRYLNRPRWLFSLAGSLASVAGLVAGCGSHSGQADFGRDNCNTPIYYVALGDSTVEGVGASKQALNYVSRLHTRLLARYPNSRLENLGRGGATSGDVVRRQLNPAIRLQPGLVTLSVGPNDITTGVSVDVYEQHIDIILSRLRQETAALVVVNLLPDLAVTYRFARGEQPDLVGRQTAMFNEALARKAREYGVVLVDLYRPSREEVPRQPELLWKDGYHPSDAGYARWAEPMWEDIDPRLADCGSKRMPARRSGAQPAIPLTARIGRRGDTDPWG